ncbi:MAG: PulJ/GspJ family protein, partial [Janthinobacterium lividum]
MKRNGRFNLSPPRLRALPPQRRLATPRSASLIAPRAWPARVRGFTLIELLIAITILAVIAVLCWRGLDQIIRAREVISRDMDDERVVVQLFSQLGSDLQRAAGDDEAGAAAV